MDTRQIRVLDKLGIDPSQNLDVIFENLLNLAEFLYDETEKSEEQRFQQEIRRLQHLTN